MCSDVTESNQAPKTHSKTSVTGIDLFIIWLGVC